MAGRALEIGTGAASSSCSWDAYVAREVYSIERLLRGLHERCSCEPAPPRLANAYQFLVTAWRAMGPGASYAAIIAAAAARLSPRPV